MEWIREWVLGICVVVMLGAVCDIIMTEGDLRKYIRPIFGMVLMLYIVFPLTKISAVKMDFDLFNKESLVDEITHDIDKVQIETINKSFATKLQDKLNQYIMENYKITAESVVETFENSESVGEIKDIVITLPQANGQRINTDALKEKISDYFGVQRERVTVKLKE